MNWGPTALIKEKQEEIARLREALTEIRWYLDAITETNRAAMLHQIRWTITTALDNQE